MQEEVPSQVQSVDTDTDTVQYYKLGSNFYYTPEIAQFDQFRINNVGDIDWTADHAAGMPKELLYALTLSSPLHSLEDPCFIETTRQGPDITLISTVNYENDTDGKAALALEVNDSFKNAENLDEYLHSLSIPTPESTGNIKIDDFRHLINFRFFTLSHMIHSKLRKNTVFHSVFGFLCLFKILPFLILQIITLHIAALFTWLDGLVYKNLTHPLIEKCELMAVPAFILGVILQFITFPLKLITSRLANISLYLETLVDSVITIIFSLIFFVRGWSLTKRGVAAGFRTILRVLPSFIIDVCILIACIYIMGAMPFVIFIAKSFLITLAALGNYIGLGALVSAAATVSLSNIALISIFVGIWAGASQIGALVLQKLLHTCVNAYEKKKLSETNTTTSSNGSYYVDTDKPQKDLKDLSEANKEFKKERENQNLLEAQGISQAGVNQSNTLSTILEVPGRSHSSSSPPVPSSPLPQATLPEQNPTPVVAPASLDERVLTRSSNSYPPSFVSTSHNSSTLNNPLLEATDPDHEEETFRETSENTLTSS